MAQKTDEAGYLETHENIMLSNEEVKGAIQESANVKSMAALRAMKKEERYAYLREINS